MWPENIFLLYKFHNIYFNFASQFTKQQRNLWNFMQKTGWTHLNLRSPNSGKTLKQLMTLSCCNFIRVLASSTISSTLSLKNKWAWESCCYLISGKHEGIKKSAFEAKLQNSRWMLLGYFECEVAAVEVVGSPDHDCRHSLLNWRWIVCNAQILTWENQFFYLELTK